MVQILISWFWIFLSSFLWGFAAIQIIKRLCGRQREDLDIILLLGLCFLTVYAQIFSLFHKVGSVANAIILFVNILFFVFLRKKIVQTGRQWISEMGSPWKLIIIASIIILLVAISTCEIKHYDSALYHAQSIRWIEEYGIVPGLGNLHNRLAYNSSFFALQALFSLQFLVGQSLHSVNGFVVALLAGYAVCSIKGFKKHGFYASDFLRVGILFFLLNSDNCRYISSPGSDILALGLVVYILVKWTSYWEDGETEIMPYATLCLLGVYAVTVKLSAAMIVLLAVLPVVNLIVKKQWKSIILYILMGLIIVVPFLARNVIISGYVLYPYPELDLFQVDWKMPEYTLIFDRNEIKAWGWGVNDVYQHDTPITEWFPIWMKSIGNSKGILFYLNIFSFIPAIIWGYRHGIKRKDWNGLLLVITMLACFVLWFVGAPLPRYGSVFLILLPLFAIGKVICFIQKDIDLGIGPGVLIFICMIICIRPAISYAMLQDIKVLNCADYQVRNAKEIFMGEEVVYYPALGDRIGYYHFPSTPYVERITLIELRGETVAQGFRMKDEYRNSFVTTYGQIHEENIFK